MSLNKTENITYLFGAGASAGNQMPLFHQDETPNETPNGIPIVKNFNKDIEAFIKYLRTSPIWKVKNVNSKDEIFKQGLDIFAEIYSDLKQIYSFDTYAKSLYESEESGERDKYEKLKLLLKCYLVFRQLIVQRDKRYDLLFATLINKKRIPGNVNFLSWNYDTQIESSLSIFIKSKNDNEPRFHSFLNTNLLKDLEQGTRDEFPYLIKLNGSVGITGDMKKFEYVNHVLDGKTQAIAAIYDICRRFIQDKEIPKIYFSWERNENKSQQLDLIKAKEILKKTSILVVVGYSFPTLNRYVDLELLDCLKDDVNIYVQCGNVEDFYEIEEKISTLKSTFKTKFYTNGKEEKRQINYVKSNNEFYVPFEFNGIEKHPAFNGNILEKAMKNT